MIEFWKQRKHQMLEQLEDSAQTQMVRLDFSMNG